jgi:hypothetical protein
MCLKKGIYEKNYINDQHDLSYNYLNLLPDRRS